MEQNYKVLSKKLNFIKETMFINSLLNGTSV